MVRSDVSLRIISIENRGGQLVYCVRPSRYWYARYPGFNDRSISIAYLHGGLLMFLVVRPPRKTVGRTSPTKPAGVGGEGGEGGRGKGAVFVSLYT